MDNSGFSGGTVGGLNPFTWESDSMLNSVRLASDQGQRYADERMLLSQARWKTNLSSVQFSKQRLGRQKFCWQGSCRNWVWENEAMGWRVFCSTEGTSFEVRAGSTPEQAYAAWDDFLVQMGVKECSDESSG